MELEEFERLNPVICDKYEGFDSKKEAIRVQGEYLKTHTFILHSLNERQAKVLRLRFGIDNGEYLNLAQIGDMLKISKERARQLEEKALTKLRHPTRIKWLMEYTDETFDKSMLEELVNFKSLIKKDIIQTINEDTLKVVKDISIDELEIKTNHTNSIKNKLKQARIATCHDLIKYLQTHKNFNDLHMGVESYNLVISAICELIEDGSVKITSQEDLNSYLEHKAGAERKENKKQAKHQQEEEQLKLRLANWDTNLEQIFIKDLKFSNRTFGCLQSARIYTLQDLINYYSIYGNFIEINNLGAKSEQEIRNRMQQLGVNLNKYFVQNRSNIVNNAFENPESVLIERLDFTNRTFNALKRLGINNLQDLIICYKSTDGLRRIKKLGVKAKTDVIEKLHSLPIDLYKFLEEDVNNSNLKA